MATGARRLVRQAEHSVSSGDVEAAVALLREAAALLADAGEHMRHGEACRRIAEILEAAGDLPNALQAYQEAVDAFGRAPGGDSNASECARRVVAGSRRIWGQPRDRLYLLIARRDDEQRRLARQPGTEAAQADIAFHTATILQRRDRFPEAARRYGEALRLYESAPDTGLQQAETHHRLAGLYQHELSDPLRAVDHYRQAIALYAAHEPPSEGEQTNRALCEWLLRQLEAPSV